MIEIEYKIKPIGYTRIEGDDPMKADYLIEILEPYQSALKELDKFSHVMVFWWANGNDKEDLRNLQKWATTPPYGEDTPETGIFATRSPIRPNPIALSTCQILDVDYEKGIIRVSGYDAFDETPIVDLKAYFPISDRVRECHIAPWLKDWPEWLEDGFEWWQKQEFVFSD